MVDRTDVASAFKFESILATRIKRVWVSFGFLHVACRY